MSQPQLIKPASPSGNRPAIQHRRERGVQLVEVVLVMPVLLLLLAATAEFGRYFYVYSALARATRVSARYMSSNLWNSSEQTKAKNVAVCGLTTTCSTAVVSGLSTSNIQITATGDSPVIPTTVTVSITGYSYQSIFKLGNWIGGSWSSVAVSPSTTMRYLLEN